MFAVQSDEFCVWASDNAKIHQTVPFLGKASTQFFGVMSFALDPKPFLAEYSYFLVICVWFLKSTWQAELGSSVPKPEKKLQPSEH